MDESKLSLVLEALLMTRKKPLAISEMRSLFDEWERPETLQIKQALQRLKEDYQNRSLELVEVAQGFRFQTREEYQPWVEKQLHEKPTRYSKALLETLAIIAYRQPVTRADIEDIRGVSVSSSIMKTLIEREWVRISGYKDVPGKPAVYSTTKQFLDYFSLQSLSELPSLELPEQSLIET